MQSSGGKPVCRLLECTMDDIIMSVSQLETFHTASQKQLKGGLMQLEENMGMVPCSFHITLHVEISYIITMYIQFSEYIVKVKYYRCKCLYLPGFEK